MQRIISFLNSGKSFSIATTDDVKWHASTFKAINNIDDFYLTLFLESTRTKYSNLYNKIHSIIFNENEMIIICSGNTKIHFGNKLFEKKLLILNNFLNKMDQKQYIENFEYINLIDTNSIVVKERIRTTI